MRFLHSFCLFTISLISSVGYCQGLDWVYGMGSESDDHSGEVVIDEFNNVYYTGFFKGTVDFDPSEAVDELTAEYGGSSCFLSKFNHDGDYQWTIKLDLGIGASPNTGYGLKLDIDNLGFIVVAQAFNETVDVDPSSGVWELTEVGSGPGTFIAIFNLDGELVNAQQIFSSGDEGFLESYTLPRSVAFTSDYEIVLTGYFEGEIPHGSTEDSLGVVNSTFQDVFLAKFDPELNLVWSMGMGGPSLDIPTDLKVNSSNEIIISGFLRESIDLDPSENEVLLESESGIGSSFLAKYSLEGDLLFAHLIAGDEICTAEEISIDANDNILVGGVFNYAMDLDPSADTVLVNTNSSSDVFLIKLSSDGSFLWGDTFGGDSYERNFGIETTDNEEIILSFHTKSQGFVLGSTGDSEFITEPSKSTVAFFDTEGVFLWGFNIGDEEPANDLIVRDVVSKGPIDFYIAGYYEGESDFTPWNPSESSLAASGMKDAFIAKYRDCDNTFSSVEVYACDSLVSPSGALTWTESGVYQEALVNAAGCDSVISTELTIVSDSLITQQIVSCDSYLWALDSTVYTESGTYYRDLVGCDEDSAILELEIPELISTTMEQACGSFTWDINGNTYIESGVYVDTLANELGCDSLFILDLIVTSINTAVIQNGITLNASLEEASYQWLDCSDDFEPLLNETSQNFTPDENGIYAVEITQDGCTDTSYCYQIVDVGIEPTSGSFFRIFPNPTEGLIFIEQNENSSKHAGIWLYSATGVLLREEKFKSTKELDLTVYPKGIYFLKLVSGESIRYERIVKK